MYSSVILPVSIFIPPLYTYIVQQKLIEQKTALGRMDFTNDDYTAMWEKVMTTTMMSSEESGNEDEEEILSVRPLLVRSANVDHFFCMLDDTVKEYKSPQACRQMKRIVRGNVSTTDEIYPLATVFQSGY